MDAKDVIDIQVTVASLDVADELADALRRRRLPRGSQRRHRRDVRATTDDPSLWRKRIHGAADPGRPANVHMRVDGWPNQQFALLFVDWLAANPGCATDYLAAKRQRARAHRTTPRPRSRGSSTPTRRAWAWADTTGWRPVADQAGGGDGVGGRLALARVGGGVSRRDGLSTRRAALQRAVSGVVLDAATPAAR